MKDTFKELSDFYATYGMTVMWLNLCWTDEEEFEGSMEIKFKCKVPLMTDSETPELPIPKGYKWLHVGPRSCDHSFGPPNPNGIDATYRVEASFGIKE